MVDEIAEYYPVLDKASEAFHKTQSQFMDNTLTLSAPTEIRNARQILAEINKSRMAMEEASFSVARKKVELERKIKKLEQETDIYEKQLLEIDIREAQLHISNIMGSVQGAIRKIHNYTIQYKQILSKLGKEELTEGDFEKDEARYHVMKVFEQALFAARSRNGIIDEGNHIYFYQIGINGAVAQLEVTEYLKVEQSLLKDGKVPSHEMQLKWLEALGKKYSNHSFEYAEKRGIILLNDKSLHIKEGGNGCVKNNL